MRTWEDNLYGFVKKDDWLSVGNLVPTRQNDPADKLFGDDKTNNLTAQWESIAAEYGVPMMAQFHSFDTEANTTFRVPVDNHQIEKGLIKEKINQSERLRALKNRGIVGDQELYNWILDDGARLADHVITRTKVAKNEVLAYGKMTIKENNLDLTVDYGVPEDQLNWTLDLSEEADIPAQIQAIIDAATEKGITLSGIYTSKKNLSKMRKNKYFQTAINGVYAQGQYLSQSALEGHLSEEYGIDTVIVNDLKYGASFSLVDDRPVITQKRYYPEDRVTFFSTNLGGKVGIGLWGQTPEEDAAKYYDVKQSSVSPYVYIMQWMEKDPTVLWTKASGLFIPVLYNPNSLFIATVESMDTLPDITVKAKAQSDTIYGVNVSSIQEPETAVIGNNAITGKSKYMSASNAITDVWGKGNFLAVDFEADNWDAYTSVKVGLEPSAGSGPAELIGEDEKDAVFKVANPRAQKLVITATDGNHTDRQEYSLKGVTLESAGA